MKKDIEIPQAKDIVLAISPDYPQWQVFLINKGEAELKNVLISSSGYGTNSDGDPIETSTLRFFFDKIAAKSTEIIERIDASVFGLNNEYWVSFWIYDKLYDRRYVFLPESISEKNMVYVSMLEKNAILHA